MPPYFDNGLFVANHNQFDSTEGIRFFKLTETGDLSAVKVFQPTSRLPMAFEIGPDGVLYVVEWGRDDRHWFNQKDGRILKVEYNGTCSATGIKDMKGALAASFANARPIYPGQAFEFPVGAVSADIHDLAGKKIMNIRKAAGAKENTLPIAKQDGILLAKFKVD